jgi:hypothetical protein
MSIKRSFSPADAEREFSGGDFSPLAACVRGRIKKTDIAAPIVPEAGRICAVCACMRTPARFFQTQFFSQRAPHKWIRMQIRSETARSRRFLRFGDVYFAVCSADIKISFRSASPHFFIRVAHAESSRQSDYLTRSHANDYRREAFLGGLGVFAHRGVRRKSALAKVKWIRIKGKVFNSNLLTGLSLGLLSSNKFFWQTNLHKILKISPSTIIREEKVFFNLINIENINRELFFEEFHQCKKVSQKINSLNIYEHHQKVKNNWPDSW